MDVSMPVMHGQEATRLLHEPLPHVKVIGLSLFEEEALKEAMRLAGAACYLSKCGAPSELFTAIRAVCART